MQRLPLNFRDYRLTLCELSSPLSESMTAAAGREDFYLQHVTVLVACGLTEQTVSWEKSMQSGTEVVVHAFRCGSLGFGSDWESV
jgi:hypothetical protein